MCAVLSKAQQEVACSAEKNVLVLAGAGSGKTRVLAERIKWHISSLKKGEKVLGITFSNKASDELRDRLIDDLGRSKLDECAFIGTIHRFCLDIVTSRGSLIGLPNELHICESYEDRLQILKEAIDNIPMLKVNILNRDPRENQKRIKELLEELSSAKRNLIDYCDVVNDDKRALFEEYDSLLIQQGVIDFDDILRYAHRILVERASVTRLYRKVYKYICIDEAQDLNKAQYELIKALAGDEIGITMVGDPNQSIYGFNGSSSDYIEQEFLDDFGAKKITLSENFRSSRRVLGAAKIIEKNFEMTGVYPIEGEFDIYAFENEEKEAVFICEKIKSLIVDGHPDVENNTISLKQCAVIARNRYVFSKLEEVFKSNDLAYTIKVAAKGSFSSESDIVKAFELGMRLLVNSKDKLHLNELSKLMRANIEGITFAEIRNPENVSENWEKIVILLNMAWTNLEKTEKEIKFHKSLEIMRNVINSEDITLNEHEKILINGDLNIWEQNWSYYIKKSVGGERSLGNFVRSVSLGNVYTTDDNGVTLTTVHMSKGQEYDVVFIMGLNEGVFPDYRAVQGDDSKTDRKQMKEERHGMFVAITRSKRLCYLTYPYSKDTPWGIKTQRASRFVTELKRKILNVT